MMNMCQFKYQRKFKELVVEEEELKLDYEEDFDNTKYRVVFEESIIKLDGK